MIKKNKIFRSFFSLLLLAIYNITLFIISLTWFVFGLVFSITFIAILFIFLKFIKLLFPSFVIKLKKSINYRIMDTYNESHDEYGELYQKLADN